MILDLRKYGGIPELGYELLAIVPYAKHLMQKGMLEGTISGRDTAPFYSFSPNHIEDETLERHWKYTAVYANDDFPNIKIHKPQLNWKLWKSPDYKRYYHQQLITFEKETIVICNRYNVEWGEKPINYFPLDVLRKLFDMLQDQYQIVYCNLGGIPELTVYDDNAPAMRLGDYEMIKKEYPKVIHIYDLHKKKNMSINYTQMRVFAGCKKYITMNGGYGIWASYMGGENIIYSVRCRELQTNSFYNWYWKLGRSNIQHVDSHENLIEMVKQKWVEKLPLINVLMRTHNRKMKFHKAVKSITDQTYKNVRIIVGCENQYSFNYTQNRPVNAVLYKPYDKFIPFAMPPFYGKALPANMYLNRLAKHTNLGLITILDDDDFYVKKTALETIARNYVNYMDLVVWRIYGKDDRIIPCDDNFLMNPFPTPGDFSGASFAVHHERWVDWEPYRRGDYRVGVRYFRDAFYGNSEIKRINEVLVKAT
jgi:hypothetical protein